MPKTLTLVLDDDLCRRFDRFATAKGLDSLAALDHALRAFLDHEERAEAAAAAVIAAAVEGDAAATPLSAMHHEDIRRWLLSWGDEGERKRPRSC
jgi:predicted transcriptional regulator